MAKFEQLSRKQEDQIMYEIILKFKKELGCETLNDAATAFIAASNISEEEFKEKCGDILLEAIKRDAIKHKLVVGEELKVKTTGLSSLKMKTKGNPNDTLSKENPNYRNYFKRLRKTGQTRNK
jgi:hypothetical protein